ncbi:MULTISPECIES: hypothetical protein [unclassified Streptomyces]|nr:hypothetical protein [Streptomyces sp. NBRC 110035]
MNRTTPARRPPHRRAGCVINRTGTSTSGTDTAPEVLVPRP